MCNKLLKTHIQEKIYKSKIILKKQEQSKRYSE
jgi:hypothetical protein